MLIQEKLGNLKDFDAGGRVIDRLPLHWYETGKRILHKQTGMGKDVVLKFLKTNSVLEQDDVVYANERCLIVIEILPCETIVVRPASMYEMAFVCYEIGNKHLPLFFENDEVLIPYDSPTLRLLEIRGVKTAQQKRKLLYPLKTTVSPHSHGGIGNSLFSKIMQRTNPASRGTA